jgi:hypothetical protein
MAGPRSLEDIKRIQKRLGDMWRGWKPGSPETKKAFYLIGERLKTEAKLLARANRIVNTGRLINTISYVPNDTGTPGIIFGVFGTPYARFHEYGAAWTEANRRAMFYFMRKTGQKPRPSKGVVRGGRITPRPFMWPTVTKNRDYIIDQIRLIGMGGDKK